MKVKQVHEESLKKKKITPEHPVPVYCFQAFYLQVLIVFIHGTATVFHLQYQVLMKKTQSFARIIYVIQRTFQDGMKMIRTTNVLLEGDFTTYKNPLKQPSDKVTILQFPVATYNLDDMVARLLLPPMASVFMVRRIDRNIVHDNNSFSSPFHIIKPASEQILIDTVDYMTHND